MFCFEALSSIILLKRSQKACFVLKHLLNYSIQAESIDSKHLLNYSIEAESIQNLSHFSIEHMHLNQFISRTNQKSTLIIDPTQHPKPKQIHFLISTPIQNPSSLINPTNFLQYPILNQNHSSISIAINNLIHYSIQQHLHLQNQIKIQYNETI